MNCLAQTDPYELLAKTDPYELPCQNFDLPTAQLSLRGCAMLRVIENFAKLLMVM